MRLAAWLLVLANLLIAAWGAVDYYVTPPRASSLTPELAPDRVKLLSPDEARRRQERAKLVACAEWGGFSTSDAERAQQYIQFSEPGVKLGPRRIEGDTSWWVLIPAMPSRAAAEARLAQIRQLGVPDATIVTDDPRYLNAISLGLFKTDQNAQRRRDELTRLGVGDAVTTMRAGPGARIFLQLRDVPKSVIEQLTEGADFSGAQVTACTRPPAAPAPAMPTS